MSIAQTAAAIAVMAVVTFLTRALPFFLFDRGGKPPKVVLYLGKYLPAGVIAMLIVYCQKGVRFTSTDQWLPALLACAAVVGLHLWKRNNMLSIMGGTIFYMVLVQVIF